MWDLENFWVAFAWGFGSAVSLPLGAVVGLFLKNPGKKACAAMMAFGGGALLFALSIDLFGETVATMNEDPHGKTMIVMLMIGALSGAFIFEFMNSQLNSRGAFFRGLFASIRRVSEMKWLFVYRAVKELQDLDLLNGIPTKYVEELVDCMKKENYVKSDIIFNDIDSYTPIYFIAKGKVKLTFEAEGELPALEVTYRRHQVFGGLSSQLTRPCRVTAEVIEDCEILTLQQKSIRELLDKAPSLVRSASSLSISTDSSSESGEDPNGGPGVVTLDDENTPHEQHPQQKTDSESSSTEKDPILELRNAHLRYRSSTDESDSSGKSGSSGGEDGKQSKKKRKKKKKDDHEKILDRSKFGDSNSAAWVEENENSHKKGKTSSITKKISTKQHGDDVVIDVDFNRVRKKNTISFDLEATAFSTPRIPTSISADGLAHLGIDSMAPSQNPNIIRLRAKRANQMLRSRQSSLEKIAPNQNQDGEILGGAQQVDSPSNIQPLSKENLKAHEASLRRTSSGREHHSKPREPVVFANPDVAHGVEALKRAQSAALSIWLGILIDGIPESLTIGILSLNPAGMSLSFIIGVFLSNFPEALSSSVSMMATGLRRFHIFCLWMTIALITGLGGGIGACVFTVPTPLTQSYGIKIIEGLAAGAMLTMIAKSCLPEAHEQGGGIVGVACLLGFLASLAVKLI